MRCPGLDHGSFVLLMTIQILQGCQSTRCLLGLYCVWQLFDVFCYILHVDKDCLLDCRRRRRRSPSQRTRRWRSRQLSPGTRICLLQSRRRLMQVQILHRQPRVPRAETIRWPCLSQPMTAGGRCAVVASGCTSLGDAICRSCFRDLLWRLTLQSSHCRGLQAVILRRLHHA